MKPASLYRPPRSLRENPPAPPTEMELQALWFEGFYPARLATDDGRAVEILQPGFWNHAGGPDFHRAALRFSDTPFATPPLVGSVEIHLQPDDWQTHGHDLDPAYDDAVLHVVWARGRKKFFPATSAFRHVPQVVLGEQLIAPWVELRPLCRSLLQLPLPGAKPGRCAPALAQLPADRMLDLVRTAGFYRLIQKARRWYWRRQLAGPAQALYEALAESLGFHANQAPMRLVAQRLPWRMLHALDPSARLAHLFGLAGFLPDENLARLRAEPRAWLRELWEIWWKARAPLDYALLARTHWKLAGQRPLNRPERRLAALARLVPQIPSLLNALTARDHARFSDMLLAVRDPFWEKHATLTGTVLAKPCRLLGEERVRDILINIFWPIVSLDDPAAARAGLSKIAAAPNHAAQLATQRTLAASLSPRQLREALVQQGLLQIYRDYCLTDCTDCRACTFPELVSGWTPPP